MSLIKNLACILNTKKMCNRTMRFQNINSITLPNNDMMYRLILTHIPDVNLFLHNMFLRTLKIF